MFLASVIPGYFFSVSDHTYNKNITWKNLLIFYIVILKHLELKYETGSYDTDIKWTQYGFAVKITIYILILSMKPKLIDWFV